jgi:hypothetical protein
MLTHFASIPRSWLGVDQLDKELHAQMLMEQERNKSIGHFPVSKYKPVGLVELSYGAGVVMCKFHLGLPQPRANLFYELMVQFR